MEGKSWSSSLGHRTGFPAEARAVRRNLTPPVLMQVSPILAMDFRYGLRSRVLEACPCYEAYHIRGHPTRLFELDPDMAFAEVQTKEEVVEQQTGGQRFTVVLLVYLSPSAVWHLPFWESREFFPFLWYNASGNLLWIAMGASGRTVFWLVLKQAWRRRRSARRSDYVVQWRHRN